MQVIHSQVLIKLIKLMALGQIEKQIQYDEVQIHKYYLSEYIEGQTILITVSEIAAPTGGPCFVLGGDGMEN